MGPRREGRGTVIPSEARDLAGTQPGFVASMSSIFLIRRQDLISRSRSMAARMWLVVSKWTSRVTAYSRVKPGIAPVLCW